MTRDTRPRTKSALPQGQPILGRALRDRIRLSRLAILAERVARAFWPLAALVGLFLGIALMGLPPLLGPVGHLALLWAAGIGAAGLAAWGAVRLRRPNEREAMARLDASAPGAPLAALTDTLAVGGETEFGRALWLSHRARAEKAAKRLRVAAPDLRLAGHDRWALRLFAVVLLAGGIIGAGPDWRATVLASFEPAPAGAGTAAAPQRLPAVEAWAVPPVHTGLDTIYLTGLAGRDEAVSLPQGTAITIRVSDAGGALTLEGDALTPGAGFRTLAEGLDEAEADLAGSGEIAVVAAGDTLARWRVEMLADAPPTIALVDLPAGTASGALELSFEAHDDWGVAGAWAEIRAPGLAEGVEPLAEPIDFALPLPLTGRAKDVAETAVRDLTAHPFAGGVVDLTLHVEDGAGQTGTTGAISVTLPGRDFRHPMARALVEQRRNLALRPDLADRVLDALQAVTRRPEAWVGESQSGAYLAIRIAIRRLAVAVADDTVRADGPDVMELLWSAALELEDGELADALERLREAEQALREAMERGASEEELAELMDELRQAMDEYLSEMMRQALEQGMDPQDPSAMPEGEMLSPEDLEDMLSRLEEALRSGDRQTAEELLSELQRMMENLQAGEPQGGGEGQETMEALQEMIQRQRDLSDRTFDEMRRERREGQSGSEGQQGSTAPGQSEGQSGGRGQSEGQAEGEGQGSEPGSAGSPGDLAAEQEALRRALEALGSQLPPELGGAAGDTLGEAGEAMGGARDNLSEGALNDALQRQMDALDALSDSLEAMQEAMAGQGQGDPTSGERRGEGRGPGDDSREDPFDRPTGTYGSIDGRATRVPEGSAADRARRLLEELRRRSGEPDRPQLELDYLERLMNPF